MNVFSVKKVFLGGAALTAAMLLVVSAAWACSPYATERARDLGNPDGPELLEAFAAAPLLIQGFAYEEDYGTLITVEWSPTGSELNRQELDRQGLTYDKDYEETKWDSETGQMQTRVLRFHRFTSSVTVPNQTTGAIYVVQRRADGGVGLKTPVVNVVAAPPPPKDPPIDTPVQTVTTVPKPETPLGTVAPSPGVRTTITPAPGAGARTGAPAPRLQRDAAQPGVVVTVVGGGAAAVRSELPIAPVEGSPGRFELAPWVDPPQLDMQTLWSGLGKTDSRTADLTGPAQSPPDGSSKVGAGLVTLGAALLLTGGLVAAPRRRALARIR